MNERTPTTEQRKWNSSPLPWHGLDRLGITQLIGGLFLGLIALFSSYDHISFAGSDLQIPQQWGVVCIAASLAALALETQLASRSRLRAACDAARAEDEAAEEGNRAAEARERQAESLERLDQAALLCARVLLDPTPFHRARLRLFLTLVGSSPPPGLEG